MRGRYLLDKWGSLNFRSDKDVVVMVEDIYVRFGICFKIRW